MYQERLQIVMNRVFICKITLISNEIKTWLMLNLSFQNCLQSFEGFTLILFKILSIYGNLKL